MTELMFIGKDIFLEIGKSATNHKFEIFDF